mmetsp:Transcript_5783/g.21038  ORF Transcript_5783/g.21038 Transcript_5783/m.21038 type:complete len:285 (-) Transcript_5783:619-1473(-)
MTVSSDLRAKPFPASGLPRPRVVHPSVRIMLTTMAIGMTPQIEGRRHRAETGHRSEMFPTTSMHLGKDLLDNGVVRGENICLRNHLPTKVAPVIEVPPESLGVQQGPLSQRQLLIPRKALENLRQPQRIPVGALAILAAGPGGAEGVEEGLPEAEGVLKQDPQDLLKVFHLRRLHHPWQRTHRLAVQIQRKQRVELFSRERNENGIAESEFPIPSWLLGGTSRKRSWCPSGCDQGQRSTPITMHLYGSLQKSFTIIQRRYNVQLIVGACGGIGRSLCPCGSPVQ